MAQILNAFENWMVKSNIQTIEDGAASATIIATVKANGYPTVAEAVAKARLEYLRGELDGECISYGEIAELQSLTEYIDAGDVQLLEAAGVPEFEEAN